MRHLKVDRVVVSKRDPAVGEVGGRASLGMAMLEDRGSDLEGVEVVQSCWLRCGPSGFHVTHQKQCH